MEGHSAIWFTTAMLLTKFSSVYSQQEPIQIGMAPPIIFSETNDIYIPFREYESIQIDCIAEGSPAPKYYWKKDENLFDAGDMEGRITMRPDSGTLLFTRPMKRDEGQYQCFAENQLGTAVTKKFYLRGAFLEPFQPAYPKIYRRALGYSLTLRCIPPRSYPKPTIFWAIVATAGIFKPIDLTDRITMDHEGNLHFVNTLSEDAAGGSTYACIVQNTVMRAIQQGAYAKIMPSGLFPTRLPPAIIWMPSTHQIALKGETWRLKCIFSGNPTPRVDFIGGSCNRSLRESFGQELVIENVQFEDEGRYECQGINAEAQTPTRRSFNLVVESKPYWINTLKSVSAGESDTVKFVCEADGIPRPMVIWYLNGVPLENSLADSRWVLANDSLTFYNTKLSDSQVIQCNASNKHGYIFTNAYWKVLKDEPPTIQVPPKVDLKAAEGQNITLTCTVSGIPKPSVIWNRGNDQLTGSRFVVLDNGNLQIKDPNIDDKGVYSCTATNKYGVANATGSLIVIEKTRILIKPRDQRVKEGTEVVMKCYAVTDISEIKNLTIEWKRNGQFIDYRLAQRLYKNEIIDNSLYIYNTITLDSGTYTCVASNGVDSDEADAILLVEGVPYPPYSVTVLCLQRSAVISWRYFEGSNNAPNQNFIIQYNTSFAPYQWTNIGIVSQYLRSYTAVLNFWGNYTFRVLAKNKIGYSYPSQHTRSICRRPPGVPAKHPGNVLVEGDKPDNLVIYWKPLTKMEQNGNGFKYEIWWMMAGTNDTAQFIHVINNPDAWYYIIKNPNVPNYTRYRVLVKARNALGNAPQAPKMVFGYTGESVPEVAPNDVRFDNTSITESSITLKWTSVDTSPQKIHGFFIGYRIEFAKLSDWPNNMRKQDLIIHEKTKVHPVIPRRKRQTASEVVVSVEDLPAHSTIQLHVRVLNKYYAGPPSNLVTFNTSVGEPDPPSTLNVTDIGATHFQLEWTAPMATNGPLLGYQIYYQIIAGLNLAPTYQELDFIQHIEDHSANTTNLTMLNPLSTNLKMLKPLSIKLTMLKPLTKYRVYIAAATSKGTGKPIFIERTTLTDTYAPRNTTITLTNKTLITNNQTLEKGTEIICTTDSNPAPFSYEWLNITKSGLTEHISSMQTIAVTYSESGDYTTLMCRVRNIVAEYKWKPDSIGQDNTTVTVNITGDKSIMQDNTTIIKKHLLSDDSPNKLSDGAIAGIVVAAAVVLILIITGIIFVARRGKTSKAVDLSTRSQLEMQNS